MNDSLFMTFYVVGVIAAFYTVSDKIGKHIRELKGNEEKKSSTIFKLAIDAVIAIPVIIFMIYYSVVGIEKIYNPPKPIEKKSVVDISGSYFGYTTNSLGQQVDTYMAISMKNDSIICELKNDFSIQMHLEYNQNELKVIIGNELVGTVYQEENKIFIEDLTEPVSWKFWKRI